MAGPELSVVCRNCGSEVSPYVTECPYCGTRIRKRAPRLEREGDEIRIREGRREKKLRRDAERRERAERAGFGRAFRARRGARDEADRDHRPDRDPGDPLHRSLRGVRCFDVQDFVILGRRRWRAMALPDRAVRLHQRRLPLHLRRRASLSSWPRARAAARLDRRAHPGPRLRRPWILAADGIDKAIGDDFAFAAGPNGMALGLLAAYVAILEPERRADPEDSYDPIAVGVAAAVLLAMPIVFAFCRSVGRDRRRLGRRALRPTRPRSSRRRA